MNGSTPLRCLKTASLSNILTLAQEKVVSFLPEPGQEKKPILPVPGPVGIAYIIVMKSTQGYRTDIIFFKAACKKSLPDFSPEIEEGVFSLYSGAAWEKGA
ncbi:MAG: hypothetical protein PHI81_05510, partial [Synergistaceae bacterium]|nr:hypothetical protein [Synergistaceae bacterium]